MDTGGFCTLFWGDYRSEAAVLVVIQFPRDGFKQIKFYNWGGWKCPMMDYFVN